jgi:hypothetical protein
VAIRIPTVQSGIFLTAIFFSLANCGGGSSPSAPPNTTPSPTAPTPTPVAACTLQPPIGYMPPPIYNSPGGNTCSVDRLSSLRECTDLVRRGMRDAIQITSTLLCSGPDTCLIDLTGVNRPITVFGATGAGFRRSDSYSYPIIDMSRGSGITVANLVFDEGATECDQCVSTIRVFDTANITIDGVTILHSKRMGIEFRRSTNLTIRNSAIQDAGVFGIWTGSFDSANILIENNNFQDVRSNAIFLTYVNAGVIRQNTLTHNHRLAIFSSCGGPCPGGQLYLGLATNIRVENNLIKDGVVEVAGIPGQAWGIEIDPGLRDVTISNNEIANNKGAGIGANPSATDVQNIVVTANKLYDNGRPFFGFEGKGIQEMGNCFSR